MPLRIGIDMDGVLADFGLAFHDVERRLFGSPGIDEGQPETEEQEQAAAVGAGRGAAEDVPAGDRSAHEVRRRRDLIWKTIQSTPDFWNTLKPIDASAVRRIHALMLQHGWEVFFITQRPNTDGRTVQRQTQQWLVAQGFDWPSVLVLGGSRGAAAGALRLDYLVDDTLMNCVAVRSESIARTILIVRDGDEPMVASARKAGIGTVTSVAEALDILERATLARANPGMLARLAQMVGWK